MRLSENPSTDLAYQKAILGSVSRTFALTIAYDGTRYAGWQNQLNAVSIQQRMEEAMKVSQQRAAAQKKK